MLDRIEMIDIAKGLGILCVVLGHSFYVDTFAHRLIYNLHMPLFFIVSGMLFTIKGKTVID